MEIKDLIKIGFKEFKHTERLSNGELLYIEEGFTYLKYGKITATVDNTYKTITFEDNGYISCYAHMNELYIADFSNNYFQLGFSHTGFMYFHC